jgi:hypothetical protein
VLEKRRDYIMKKLWELAFAEYVENPTAPTITREVKGILRKLEPFMPKRDLDELGEIKEMLAALHYVAREDAFKVGFQLGLSRE